MSNSNEIIEAYESFINGQFKQAKRQMNALIGEGVRPDELIEVLEFVQPETLVRFLARVALTDEVSREMIKPPLPVPVPPSQPVSAAPDVKKHNPNPEYIRWIVRQKGLNLTEAASLIGMPHSTFMDKLSPAKKTEFSYCEQYTLENL